MKLTFLHADKHKHFQQDDFDTLDIKISYKVIILLLGMVSHSQSTQRNKLAMSLQYLEREVSHKPEEYDKILPVQ